MGLDDDRSPANASRVLARVGKPHGLRGEVTVELRTDDPQGRLAPGAELAVAPAHVGPLTVSSVRVHQGVYLIGFEGVVDRSDAERLRGLHLLAEADRPSDPMVGDTDEYYEDQLRGLRVELASGEYVGRVSALHTRPAQDLLEVRTDGDGTALVPFVAALVPLVDLEAGRVVIDPPPGLLDLDR